MLIVTSFIPKILIIENDNDLQKKGLTSLMAVYAMERSRNGSHLSTSLQNHNIFLTIKDK